MHLYRNDIKIFTNPHLAGVLWIIASFAGYIIGGWILTSETPRATTVLGVLPGVPLATLQCILLFYLLRGAKVNTGRIWLWVPITTFGFSAMVIPYRFIPIDAYWIINQTIPALPGSVILGITQWVFVLSLFNFRFSWIIWTCVGVILGGAMNYYIFSYFPHDWELFRQFDRIGYAIHLPLDYRLIDPSDYLWIQLSGAIGLGIGILQAIPLVQSLRDLKE